ncbi:hypothetical protein WMY93_019266 [Mugilogobius chulae]|uniref:Uncharacterized protein n=1 Tax=Mugilogobius chulae TaxID=88201 RepID=A0AAW0NGL5_9GOBI
MRVWPLVNEFNTTANMFCFQTSSRGRLSSEKQRRKDAKQSYVRKCFSHAVDKLASHALSSISTHFQDEEAGCRRVRGHTGSEDSPLSAAESETPTKDNVDSPSPKESETQAHRRTVLHKLRMLQRKVTANGSFTRILADAALSQCDMAEELSRQLEDILSTYCRESVSDDNTVANGQSHSPEFNGLSKDQDKQGGGKVSREVDKEQTKSQDKKK